MTSLTKEQIRNCKGWLFDEVEVPEWGGIVRLRALTVAERLQLASETRGESLTGDAAFRFFARVIMLSVVDQAGERVFDPATDYELLTQKTWGTLESLADRIMAFNGMKQASAGELEKN